MTYSARINVEKPRILVLIIDIDDDLGAVGIKTPIVGYDEVRRQALEFAQKKPNDSDVNAIFAGLAAYDKFVRNGFDTEIAVLSGHQGSWSEAFLRINNELRKLKEKLRFDSIYFVSDGVSDEQLLPVVSNYGKVVGVERVLVEQSRNIEETYILLVRYFKKALSEQPYARFFLGVPGLLLIILSVMALIGLSQYMWDTFLLILGVVFVYKGFGVSGWFRSKWSLSPLVALLYAFSIIFLGLALMITGWILYMGGFTVSSLIMIINYTVFPYLIGIILLYGGRLFDKLLSSRPHLLWRDSLIMIPLIFLLLIIQSVQSRLEEEQNFYVLLKLLISPSVLTILLVMIVSTLAVAILFMVMDKVVARRG